MSYKLYDLALSDSALRPSPWCWLVRFALLHKGLTFETVPLRFAEKDNYPDPEYTKLPILTVGEEVICDSAQIIAWLERTISATPLTNTLAERVGADFCLSWVNTQLFPALAPISMVRIWALAHDDDKEYYRYSRETRFGKTLEELAATPGQVEQVERVINTLAGPFARHKFLGGDSPNLADYYISSVFMWQRIAGIDRQYELPQSVAAWQERMLDMHDGYARSAPIAA